MLSKELKDLFIPQEVPSLGEDSASVYMLVDVPNYINVRDQTPLSVENYNILIKALISNNLFKTEEEILQTIKISPSLKYAPKDAADSYKGRKVNNIDIRNLKELNLQEIEKVSPKVIIATGPEAIKLISNFKFKSFEEAEEYNKHETFTYNNIPVVFLPSISSSFNKTGNFLRKEVNFFSGGIKKAINLSNGIESKNPLKDLKWTRIDAFNPEEVETLFNLFIENSKVVLDYEASGLHTYKEGFHLGGIGLSSLDCKTSVYIHFYDFFRMYDGTNLVPQESLDLINSFFQTKSFVVFNKQYECSVTLSPSVGINFNLKKCEDLLMWLRCLSNSSSLKDACVNRLGINKWNDAVEDWVYCINNIVKLEKPTESMKGQRKEIEWMMKNCNGFFDIVNFFEEEYYSEILKELKRVAKNKPKVFMKLKLPNKDMQEILDYIETNKKRLNSSKEKAGILEELKLLPIFSKMLPYEKYRDYFIKKKDIELLHIIDKLKRTCNESINNFVEFDSLLKDYIFRLLENHKTFEYASYAEIPIQLIEPYCIADCHFTAQLYHNVKKDLEDKNLLDAAKVYDNQAYLGHVLSRNGIAWDDTLASELEEEYSKIRLESLRSLIILPSMIKVLDLNPAVLLNVKATTDIEYLKNIFNPNSSYNYQDEKESLKTTYRMSKVLGTPRFKLASIIYEAFEYLKQVDSEATALKEFPTFFPLYKQIVKLDTTEERLNFLETILENHDDLTDQFIKNLTKYRSKSTSSTPVEALRYRNYKPGVWELPSLDRTATERLFNIFIEIIKVDTTEDSTWPEEFLALYYFKIFKKVEKSIGTYLNGNIGRSFVEIVKKDDIENKAPLRLCNYFDRPKTEDEIYITKTDWGVCTASTKRWQAAQHTVPKSTELMDLRTTRYGNEGIKLHYDYSQAEVRVLAKLANDENLLKAFEQGIDVHRHNASIMWGKPPEEISDTERSMAKGVTFSLLYGTSLSEFANKYTKGNISEARSVMSSFFRNYPNVEKFIYNMHKKGILTNTVPSILGDPIYVDMPNWVFGIDKKTKFILLENPYSKDVLITSKNKNISEEVENEKEKKERAKLSKAMRNSQNYGIQGSSSLLAGIGMVQLQEIIEKRDLSTKLECFTHDSCDLDLKIKDLIETLRILPEASIDYIKEKYDIPMKVDVAIGVSNNKLIELDDIQLDNNSIKAEFSGTEEALFLLKEKIDNQNGNLFFTVKESKEKIISIDDLFITTNAYAKALGKPFTVIKGILEISL